MGVLGVVSAVRGVTFDPLIPLPLWLSAAVLSLVVGLAYVLYRPPGTSRGRRLLVTGLSLLGMAGPLVLLLNPSRLRPQTPPQANPLLVVLLDSSRSMATGDADGHTRFGVAAADVHRLLGELGASFEVELQAFDREARALAVGDLQRLEPRGMTTDLAAALRSSIERSGRSPDVILLLSDGIDHGAGGEGALLAAAQRAVAVGVPVFARCYGGARTGEDLSLELAATEQLAFVGEEVELAALVSHPGVEAGEVEVTCRYGDEEAGTQTVPVTGPEPVRAAFPVSQQEAGQYLYQVAVTPRPDELTRGNNSRLCQLTVVDQPVGVLLLEGKPYWDSKFLVGALSRDPAVALTAATVLTEERVLVRRVGTGRQADGQGAVSPGGLRGEDVEVLDSAWSLLEDDRRLRGYGVIVLGRQTEAFLSPLALENLRRWVGDWGGSLVCSRGQPTELVPEKLDALLPVRWSAGREQRFRLRLTPAGGSLGWFTEDADPQAQLLERLPSLVSGTEVKATKPLGVTLARASAPGQFEETPVLTYQRFGAGRTVVLEGGGMWRWALLPPRSREYGQLYERFWASLLRWLIIRADLLPAQVASLRTSKALFSTEEPAVLELLQREVEGSQRSAAFDKVNSSGRPSTRSIAQAALSGVEGRPEPVERAEPSVEIADGDGNTVKQVTLRSVGRAQAESEGAPVLFRATAGRLPVGVYRARLAEGEGAAPCAFEVSAPVDELLELSARPGLLSSVAEAAGGRLLERDEVGRLQEHYRSYWQTTHPVESKPMSLWDRLYVMLVAVGVWSCTWLVRRRGGLV